MTIRRGDILWADLGMFPTTSVQGGVRPVIVVSNNKANTYSSVITVVPLTSRISTHGKLPYDAFQYLSLWKAVTIPSTQEKEKKN